MERKTLFPAVGLGALGLVVVGWTLFGPDPQQTPTALPTVGIVETSAAPTPQPSTTVSPSPGPDQSTQDQPAASTPPTGDPQPGELGYEPEEEGDGKPTEMDPESYRVADAAGRFIAAFETYDKNTDRVAKVVDLVDVHFLDVAAEAAEADYVDQQLLDKGMKHAVKIDKCETRIGDDGKVFRDPETKIAEAVCHTHFGFFPGASRFNARHLLDPRTVYLVEIDGNWKVVHYKPTTIAGLG